jgi:hypothetical protein
VGYFRRWYGNFQVVDNRSLTAADFREYSITVPTDSRLGNSGQVLGGLYEVDPAKALLVNADNYTTFADHYGKQKEHWNGVDITINARPRNGFTIQGGSAQGGDRATRARSWRSCRKRSWSSGSSPSREATATSTRRS